jgi:hypothetical protein
MLVSSNDISLVPFSHCKLPQYQRPWIQVFGPSVGVHFVAPSNSLQVCVGSGTKVKLENVVRTFLKKGKRKKDEKLEKGRV